MYIKAMYLEHFLEHVSLFQLSHLPHRYHPHSAFKVALCFRSTPSDHFKH